MNPLSALRLRNISIALTIMVVIPPLVFLASSVWPAFFAPAGSLAIYVFLLYTVVALVGGIGARLRARKRVPVELTPAQERYAVFASLRQHLALATNVALILVPLAGFVIGRVLDNSVDQSNPFAFSASGLVFLVLILPLFAYAVVSAVVSLFWLLPAQVVLAEQYTITNRLPGRRRIMVARTISFILLLLGLLASAFLVLFGLGGLF